MYSDRPPRTVHRADRDGPSRASVMDDKHCSVRCGGQIEWPRDRSHECTHTRAPASTAFLTPLPRQQWLLDSYLLLEFSNKTQGGLVT